MRLIAAALYSAMACSVLSASIKVKEEHRTAFFGEDVHILVPSLDSSEVVFRPRVNPLSEVVLYQNGMILNLRAKLIVPISHLILEDVGEEDEGMYVVKNAKAPADVRRMTLIVRDCALETAVKYGESYHIQIHDVVGPITLEFRPSQLQPNQTTESPAIVLLNQSITPLEEYVGRLSANSKRVNLHGVTGADEGSYTVLDADGKVRKRTCLNVREHLTFLHVQNGGTLKFNLHLDHTKVNLVYAPNSDEKDRVVLEEGVLQEPLDPLLDGRLSVEGSLCYLKGLRVGDMGVFRVTDLVGFHVASIYVEMKPYKLPQLYVAVISLLSLLALLLLVCLLSCLINVHHRAERARKLTLIAQQAGKGEGEAFRQVVHEAYARFTEESVLQSTWDNTTESTEVEIKGLEVSKAGRYHTLQSDKNFLEMSDSGVEFTCSTLPLDSDSDAPPTYKLIIDTAAAPASIPEGNANASCTPASTLGAGPAAQPESEGDLLGETAPKTDASPAEPDVPAPDRVPETSKDAAPPESSAGEVATAT